MASSSFRVGLGSSRGLVISLKRAIGLERDSAILTALLGIDEAIGATNSGANRTTCVHSGPAEQRQLEAIFDDRGADHPLKNG
jgi:hypothetical protein